MPPAELVHALEKLHKKLGEAGGGAPPSSTRGRPGLGGSTDTNAAGSDSPRRTATAASTTTVPSARDLAEEVGHRPLPTEILGSPSPFSPSVPSSVEGAGSLNLKPGSGVLSPGRSPAAIAVVSGSSLRINANSKQAKASASAPPLVPSNRPSTTPKSFSPAGRLAMPHDRGARQWSSPAIVTADDPPGAAEKATVTYQVYTAQDISAGRGPMRSLPAVTVEPKKTSVGARVGMVVVGALVVILTAAAVIAVSTEDPKPPAPSAPVTAQPRHRPVVTATALPEPPPSTFSIGDPVEDPQPAPQPMTPAPVAKPKPRATTPGVPTVKGNGGSSPPPNPYGK